MQPGGGLRFFFPTIDSDYPRISGLILRAVGFMGLVSKKESNERYVTVIADAQINQPSSQQTDLPQTHTIVSGETRAEALAQNYIPPTEQLASIGTAYNHHVFRATELPA